MFKTIVVPVDGSPTSDEAVGLAISLAKEQQARIVFCHALEDVAMIDTTTMPPIDPTFALRQAQEYGARILSEAIERARNAGVEASSKEETENPVPLILQVAKEEHADVIVMGTHGRRGLGRAIVGSTTEGVLRRAETPVLAIRHKDAKT